MQSQIMSLFLKLSSYIQAQSVSRGKQKGGKGTWMDQLFSYGRHTGNACQRHGSADDLWNLFNFCPNLTWIARHCWDHYSHSIAGIISKLWKTFAVNNPHLICCPIQSQLPINLMANSCLKLSNNFILKIANIHAQPSVYKIEVTKAQQPWYSEMGCYFG